MQRYTKLMTVEQAKRIFPDNVPLVEDVILDVDKAVYDYLAETGFENPPIIEENYVSPRFAAAIARVRKILDGQEKPI